jgi:ADP-ribosylglycohydrolase
MNTLNTEKNDRIRGMLWGLITGDCLGSPAQFMDMAMDWSKAGAERL